MVHLHVWGDHACFTNPALKVERYSYPIMTPSAARAVLEAIYYKPQMAYVVTSIRVVKRGHQFSCRRNELNRVPSFQQWQAGERPIRAGAGQFTDNTQRGMTALADVAYVISADIVPSGDEFEWMPDKHREIFTHRAHEGKFFHQPYLGCKEFPAFFELIDSPEQLPAADWSEELDFMLYDVFDPDLRLRANGRRLLPSRVLFRAEIVDGVMNCDFRQLELYRQQPRYSA